LRLRYAPSIRTPNVCESVLTATWWRCPGQSIKEGPTPADARGPCRCGRGAPDLPLRPGVVTPADDDSQPFASHREVAGALREAAEERAETQPGARDLPYQPSRATKHSQRLAGWRVRIRRGSVVLRSWRCSAPWHADAVRAHVARIVRLARCRSFGDPQSGSVVEGRRVLGEVDTQECLGPGG